MDRRYPCCRGTRCGEDFHRIGNNPLDPHSTQTNILNRCGRLVYRTGELPPPEQIANILRNV